MSRAFSPPFLLGRGPGSLWMSPIVLDQWNWLPRLADSTVTVGPRRCLRPPWLRLRLLPVLSVQVPASAPCPLGVKPDT